MELQPTPVEREARRLGLPVLTPKTLKDEAAQAEFRAHKADAAVVVAYGLILPKPILDAPRLGCFNVHASLLPRWRGAAPINRADHGGRRRERRHHHADGRRSRHRRHGDGGARSRSRPT